MSNTNTPISSGSCRTLIPTRGVFLCRKEVGKLSHLPGEGLFESRRADSCDFFHHLQFLLYLRPQQTSPAGLYLLHKGYLFLLKEIQLPPALETLVPAEHLIALVEANPGKTPLFHCTPYSTFTFIQEPQHHITRERLSPL